MIYGRPVIQVLKSVDVFFEHLVPRTAKPTTHTDWRAEKLREFIDQHQGKICWKLGDACKHLGFPMSDRQARRLFKASIGMGFRNYARNRRLTFAAEQLRTIDIPTKVIAADSGYQTASHFARSFKKVFRVNPMEFRRMWRQKAVAA